VSAAFSRPPKLELAPDTPLTRLALLAPGPVITTNFDPGIEAVYAAGGSAFDDDRLVLGRKDPFRVVQALQENQPTLIKLHGDAAHCDSLTFTAVEYELSYGKTGSTGPVEQLATVLYTNRPLLFIGCSLETDRTLQSLKRVHSDNPYLRFYAILASSYGEPTRAVRMKTLADAGISTLWFRPGRFEEISAILDGLVRRVAVDVSSSTRTREVPRSVALPEPLYPDRSPSDPGPSGDAAVEALMQGRLLFFLGAGVHLTRLRGNEFYLQICKRADIPPPTRGRADAAQYVADAIGREHLSRIVDEIVRVHLSRPSNVHVLLTNLSRALREARVTAVARGRRRTVRPVRLQPRWALQRLVPPPLARRCRSRRPTARGV
jgi:SIR2-like protein